MPRRCEVLVIWENHSEHLFDYVIIGWLGINKEGISLKKNKTKRVTIKRTKRVLIHRPARLQRNARPRMRHALNGPFIPLNVGNAGFAMQK